jgi:hypothetical protein
MVHFYRELDFIVGKKALPENEQIFLLSSRGTGVTVLYVEMPPSG